MKLISVINRRTRSNRNNTLYVDETTGREFAEGELTKKEKELIKSLNPELDHEDVTARELYLGAIKVPDSVKSRKQYFEGLKKNNKTRKTRTSLKTISEKRKTTIINRTTTPSEEYRGTIVPLNPHSTSFYKKLEKRTSTPKTGGKRKRRTRRHRTRLLPISFGFKKK